MWDGFQWVPSDLPPPETDDPRPINTPEPDAAFPVLGAVVGLFILIPCVLGLIFDRSDIGYDAVAAAIAAIGLGLLTWAGIEFLRIWPLPKRLADETVEHKLAYALRFSPEQLSQNRNGHMSVMQRLRLLGLDAGWWLAAVTCLGGAALILIRYWSDPIKDARILIVTAVGLFALWKAGSGLVDAVRGGIRVEVTDLTPIMDPRSLIGALLPQWRDSTIYYAYQAKDGRQFWVSLSAYQALKPGRYRVCFAPLSGKLMSIEPAPG
jgi:hypothetical protein